MNPARFLYPTRGFLNTTAASRRISASLTRNARAYHDNGFVAPSSVRGPRRLSGAHKIGTKSETPEASHPGVRGSESLPTAKIERKLCVYFATR
jgi:hypothetical protein